MRLRFLQWLYYVHTHKHVLYRRFLWTSLTVTNGPPSQRNAFSKQTPHTAQVFCLLIHAVRCTRRAYLHIMCRIHWTGRITSAEIIYLTDGFSNKKRTYYVCVCVSLTRESFREFFKTNFSRRFFFPNLLLIYLSSIIWLSFFILCI